MTFTNTEVITIIGLVLGLVVPTLTSIFAYRQALKKISADKAAADEADDTKRLEIMAGLPEETAKAFDTGSRALRDVITFLNDRDKESRKTIESLLKEITARDQDAQAERQKFTQEITLLRNEVQTLTRKVDEQSHGIGILTSQIEELGKTPRYKRKTGPLADGV